MRRNGKVYTQEYERGKPIRDVKEVGVSMQTGTKITFRPDREIFHDTSFDYDILELRLRDLAFLNKGISITLTDCRPGQEKESSFFYVGGVADYVEWLNRTNVPLHKPIYVDCLRDNVHVELALQYASDEKERVRCYANAGYTAQGGTHLTGFRAGLTRSLNNYARKENLLNRTLCPMARTVAKGRRQ